MDDSCETIGRLKQKQQQRLQQNVIDDHPNPLDLGKKLPKINTSHRGSCKSLLQVTLSIITVVYIIFKGKPLLSSVAAQTDLFSTGDDAAGDQDVDKCEACRILVSSFDKGMAETARGKHESGDTSWEEKNLKNYADSEVRLVEIQENLCEEAKRGKAQCLSMARDTESTVEDWWFKHRPNNVRLFDHLCISKLKNCCPEGRFGPTCQACLSVCNKHGVCDGSGTRVGTGKCNCDLGYRGDDCDTCEEDHFRISTSDHFTCRKCDLACKSCYGPGRTNCTECRSGYYIHETNGCVDFDECQHNKDVNGNSISCGDDEYCVNTDGSYRCASCHVACKGCVDYGSDMCFECASGYEFDDDKICRSRAEMMGLGGPLDASDEESWKEGSKKAKYLIYGVIWVLTLVMFRNSIHQYTIALLCFTLLNWSDLWMDLLNQFTSESASE